MKLDDFLSKKVTWKFDKRKTDSVKFVSKRLHWKLWLMSMRVINSLQTDCTTLKFYVSGGFFFQSSVFLVYHVLSSHYFKFGTLK